MRSKQADQGRSLQTIKRCQSNLVDLSLAKVFPTLYWVAMKTI